jgi:hypothetical protein
MPQIPLRDPSLGSLPITRRNLEPTNRQPLPARTNASALPPLPMIASQRLRTEGRGVQWILEDPLPAGRDRPIAIELGSVQILENGPHGFDREALLTEEGQRQRQAGAEVDAISAAQVSI